MKKLQDIISELYDCQEKLDELADDLHKHGMEEEYEELYQLSFKIDTFIRLSLED